MHTSGDAGIFESNMYLAEDRILCFELVAKKNEAWLLKYVKSAKASTDVPDSIGEFISQRRRWLNGSFFASVYALVHQMDIWRSDHSTGRKMFFHLEFFYQFVSLFFSWFALVWILFNNSGNKEESKKKEKDKKNLWLTKQGFFFLSFIGQLLLDFLHFGQWYGLRSRRNRCRSPSSTVALWRE